MEEYHFEHWLKIWKETVNELFTGEMAENAKNRAQNIAKIMAFKMKTMRL